MEKKGTKGKERKIKVDKYMQNEYKRSKTEKGVIKGMNERERKNAQRRKNDKIKKRIENKYKNLKVWVHDGIPFFYINILKFGGWGG